MAPTGGRTASSAQPGPVATNQQRKLAADQVEWIEIHNDRVGTIFTEVAGTGPGSIEARCIRCYGDP